MWAPGNVAYIMISAAECMRLRAVIKETYDIGGLMISSEFLIPDA